MKYWFHDPQLTVTKTLEQEPEPVHEIVQVPPEVAKGQDNRQLPAPCEVTRTVAGKKPVCYGFVTQ